MVNWFWRRPNRIVVPRLKSRGEDAANVNRVDLAELTPGLLAYLGQAAYLQLVIFEMLAQVVATAPSTAAKEATSRVAALSLERHQALAAEITRKGTVPADAMALYSDRIDRYRTRVTGRDWYETLVASFVTSGLLNDFYRRLAAGLADGVAGRLAVVFASDDGHDLLLEQLRAAIEQDPRLASRLAMWGRRLVGDTLLVARSALAMPQNGHPDEARLEPVFTELIAAHTRRLDALGLTA
ncbi:MAG: hypothetical protein JWO10_1949 [Microbacteriaceae bacterium]|nr:hypothetical protein [Microbacteriaceae bacterium]